MPDDPQELRQINWAEAFPFTQLFRSFRLAIHPQKLLLALVALMLTYALGRVMDQIWPSVPVMPGERMAIPDTAPSLPIKIPALARAAMARSELGGPERTTEVRAYIDQGGCTVLCDWRKAATEASEKRQAALLARISPDITPDKAKGAAEEGEARAAILNARNAAQSEAEGVIETVGNRIRESDSPDKDALLKAYEDVAVGALVGPTAGVKSGQAMASLAELAKDEKICGKEERGKVAKAIQAQAIARDLRRTCGKGIFATFLNHEIGAFHTALAAVLALDVGLGSEPATGLKGAFVDAGGGVVWLFGAHWFYAVIFAAISLLIWSLFGGAVCRIAALHAARDEKISLKQAMKFSGRKWGSFFAAPLIPISLIAVIGAFVFLGGLFCAIPYFGEIVAGIFWPLALFAGFIMVLVIMGTIGGSMLMFPTIAVEGSDAFDALSRSFSYVYSKPWRTGFYVLVSGLYGAICYLFVRMFVHVLLNVTHVAVGLGVNIDGSGVLPDTVGKLDAVWTRTALLDSGWFIGAFGQYPLGGWTEGFLCVLVTVWTYIVLGVVVAFAGSFFFSASTMIYYLLRREVDATDVEDVYLEEYEEDLAPVTSAPSEPPAETSADEPAEGQAPETEEGGEEPKPDEGG